MDVWHNDCWLIWLLIHVSMKLFRSISLLLLVILSMSLVIAQTNSTPTRTPEQEATIQTERMQQDLELSEEQVQRIYEINLQHARQRKVATSRSEALLRVKNKDTQLQQVLSPEQFNRMQDKRYERTPATQNGPNRTVRTVPQNTAPGDNNSATPRSSIPLNQRTTPSTRRTVPIGTQSREGTERVITPRNSSESSQTQPGRNVERSTPTTQPSTNRSVERSTPATQPSRNVERSTPASRPAPREPVRTPAPSSNQNSSSGQRR